MKPIQFSRCVAAMAVCGALSLAACSSQTDLRKAELAALTLQLPGDYDNSHQVLTILRLAAPLVGDQVFYVRETAADDARRVISEHIWNLDVAADKRIIGTVYRFEEPDRWRHGADGPELFRSLLMRDLQPLAGCAMIWRKSSLGFSAAGATDSCPQSWRLEGDALSFSEHSGAAADGFYHFARRVGAH